MTQLRRQAGATASALIGVSVIIAGALLPLTSAQWSDDSRFSAAAATGTWQPTTTLGSCTVVDVTGTAVPSETCSVSAITLVEQGGAAAGGLLRVYELSVTTTASDPSDRVSFTVDLAAPEVTSVIAVPNPAWTWTNASTATRVDYTTAPGYQCAALPTLDGTAPVPVSNPIHIEVHDYQTADRNCSP